MLVPTTTALAALFAPSALTQSPDGAAIPPHSIEELGWSATFGADGATCALDTKNATFALRLDGVGYEGARLHFTGNAEVRTEGTRVAYRHAATIEEWYERRDRGVEHGFTLFERPQAGDCADARLAIDLAVDGDLRAHIEDGARDATFRIGPVAVFDYSGLTVIDADGRDVPARFEPLESGLRISIDDRVATYPLIVDPLVQRAYIKSPSPDAEDRFGLSVAASGDRIAVGAVFEDSASTGVGGNAFDNTAADSGAVFVYRRAGNDWMFEAYIKASNTGVLDRFGRAIDMDGDVLVVGAPSEGSDATGVDGVQSNDDAPDSGAVYVFRDAGGGAWAQEAYLKASNTGAGDEFGHDLELDGDLLVVGAFGEDSGDPADETNDAAPDAGAAYVFERVNGSWTGPVYLKHEHPDRDDRFGEAVAVEESTRTVVVGAPREDGASQGIGGDQTSDAAFDSGAAFAFDEVAGSWIQTEYLKASNASPGDNFGDAVAIDGAVTAIGAPFEDSGSPGVNGDQSDNSQPSSGAVYTFVRPTTTWLQDAYVKASNPGSFDWFGMRLDVDFPFLVVGAIGERSGATGVNGNQADNSAGFSGAAYVFRRGPAPWSQVAFLKASNTNPNDSFGVDVSLDGTSLVVGASREDGGSPGVNGNQSNNSASNAGAAYAFDLYGAPITTYCTSQPNSTGASGVISATGSPSVAANDLTLEASSLPQNAFGFFLASQVRGFAANPGGSQGDLCLGGAIGRYVGPGQVLNSGMTGSFALAIDNQQIPQPTGLVPAIAGEAWHFQAWHRDLVLGVSTSNFTNGLTVIFE